MKTNRVTVDFTACFDCEEMERTFSPNQMRALMGGVAQVLAANQAPQTATDGPQAHAENGQP